MLKAALRPAQVVQLARSPTPAPIPVSAPADASLSASAAFSQPAAQSAWNGRTKRALGSSTVTRAAATEEVRATA